MTRYFSSFLEQNRSVPLCDSHLNPAFQVYTLPPDVGKGYSAVYEWKGHASIYITDHYYHQDMTYSLPLEKCFTIQEYDNLFSEGHIRCVPPQVGMQLLRVMEGEGFFQYTIKKETPAKLIGIQFMPDYFDVYLRNISPGEAMHIRTEISRLPSHVWFPEVSHIFHQIRHFRGGPLCSTLYYRSKINEVLIMLAQGGSILQRAFHVSAADYDLILKTISDLNRHLDAHIPLAELARQSCMSPTKFKNTFRAVVGYPLSMYLYHKRLMYACELLVDTDLPISAIAEKVGYKNAGSFSVQFKKALGILPSEYRQQKASGALTQRDF